MRRERADRVHGPYQHGKKWRVVLVRNDGKRRVVPFASRTEAERFIADAQIDASGITIKAAVEAYVKSLIARGLKFATYDRAEDHLHRLLRVEVNGGRPIGWIAKRGEQLYELAQEKSAVDSHRNALAAGKAFGRWCAKRGWLRADPFADVEGVGRRRRGKPQLRVDESRKLTALCLELGAKPEPVAVLAALLLGPRASEIVQRDVRDLDDNGSLLWIPDSKTEAGKRQLEIPWLLQPLLRELAKDRPGDAPLFLDRHGKRPTRWWLAYHCRALCGRAKVPTISPHGLRGTHSSLASRGGATGELVAAQLGHASPAITRRVYVRPEASQAASAEAVELRLLQGGAA